MNQRHLCAWCSPHFLNHCNTIAHLFVWSLIASTVGYIFKQQFFWSVVTPLNGFGSLPHRKFISTCCLTLWKLFLNAQSREIVLCSAQLSRDGLVINQKCGSFATSPFCFSWAMVRKEPSWYKIRFPKRCLIPYTLLVHMWRWNFEFKIVYFCLWEGMKWFENGQYKAQISHQPCF